MSRASFGQLDFWLGMRLLSKGGQNRVFSGIALVSVLGVLLGTAALITVTSVVNGFRGEIARIITRINGDIIVYSRGNPIQDPAHFSSRVTDELSKLGFSVVQMQPSFVTEVMLSSGLASRSAVLEGIDQGLWIRSGAGSLDDSLISGKMPEQDGEILIGSALASTLGAKVGDTLSLVAPFVFEDRISPGEASVLIPESRRSQRTVSGIFHLGMHQYDSKWILEPLTATKNLLQSGDAVTTFKIQLANINATSSLYQNDQANRVRSAAEALEKSLAFPYRVKDWSQVNKNLFFAIHHQKALISIVLSLIVLVAAFNVVSTMMMTIHEKKESIAILKAMGYSKKRVFRLFSSMGFLLGVMGATAGFLVSQGLLFILNRTRFIELPPEIYNLGYLPVEQNPVEIISILLFSVVACTLAATFPAMIVARKSPIDGIRLEF